MTLYRLPWPLERYRMSQAPDLWRAYRALAKKKIGCLHGEWLFPVVLDSRHVDCEIERLHDRNGFGVNSVGCCEGRQSARHV